MNTTLSLIFSLFFALQSFACAEEEDLHVFYEELVPKQAGRDACMAFVRKFSEKNCSIVQTDRALFYVENGDDLFDEEGIEPILEQFVKAGSTAVDYGAKFGQHALILTQLVGMNGRVVAVEPSLAQFRQLFWNAVLNHVDNIQLYCSKHNKNQGLDALRLQNVSLIKIDAEGQEALFLEGAQKTIKRDKPVLIVKILGGILLEKADRYVKDEFEQRLKAIKALGYNIEKMNNTYYLATPK